MVTKEDLSQLHDLRQEIAELEDKIGRMEKRGSRVVSDKVHASSKEFPYTETSIKITGYDVVTDKRLRKRILNKKLLLQERKEKAEEAELRLTEYINTIEDSRIRRLIEYKYVEGYTWEKIGNILHCDRTTAEKTLAKYLSENPEQQIWQQEEDQ